jgi:hypothetical protein
MTVPTVPLALDYQVRGMCPTQAHGSIDGYPLYFRYRGGRWGFYVASRRDGDAVALAARVPGATGFVRTGWHGHPLDGAMAEEQVHRIIRRCASAWQKGQIEE